jgi:hypothetical protein
MQTTFTAVGRRLIAPLTVIIAAGALAAPAAARPDTAAAPPAQEQKQDKRTEYAKDAADHRTPSDLAAQTSEAPGGPGFDLGDAAIGAGAGALAALSLGAGVTRRRRLTAAG